MKKAHITPELFRFFRQLGRNNNRDWFAKNKARYESVVREPLLQLVSDFGPHLRRVHPRLVADPRPVGGSLFRIHRDVRFSKDKSPYKSHAGLRFPHEEGKNVHTPGYYLHLEPGSVFMASGIWHPDPPTLRMVRDTIVAEPAAWKRAVGGRSFRASCTLGGDSLQKPPKGYDPDHPLIEDLKRKDFIAYVSLTEREACSSDLIGRLTRACLAMKPMMGFLTRAVGATW
jgi:uncharacterized protein (TIGR02453 family)